MDIDYGAWRFLWEVVISLLIGMNTLYTWLVTRSKANREAFDQQAQRMNALESDMRQLSTEVRALPDHEALGAIHDKVNTIATSMANLQGELAALNRNLGLLFEDRLSNGGKCR